MFAIIAAILFAVAWILDVAGVAKGVFFTSTSFMLLGLFFFALHFVFTVGLPRRSQ
jgi:hypothetical protein